MTDTARARLEAEAAELYPCKTSPTDCLSCPGEPEQRAFIAGRTVTAEQVEAGAAELFERQQANGQTRVLSEPTWESFIKENKVWAAEFRNAARAAFRAAGFYVEGADDE